MGEAKFSVNNVIIGEERAPQGFSVSVRNTEPMLQLKKGRKAGSIGEIILHAASAAVVVAALSLMLAMAGQLAMIPFTLAALILFVIVDSVDIRMPYRGKGIALAVTFAVLVVSFIVLRKYIINGGKLILNDLYEYAEQSQAYVYGRYNIGETGENNPWACMAAATVWTSLAAAAIASIPPAKYRRGTITVIAVLTMICFAYFGVEPHLIITGILALFILLAMGNGRLLTALPLILAAALVFGAVVLVDPGESTAVSRVNENIRDRLAFRTATIEGMESDVSDDYDEEDQEEQDQDGILDGEGESELTPVLITACAAVILIAAAIYLIHRRLKKKRDSIRAGINSNDPNTAIGAMFPYAVRWLRPCGIEVGNTAFSDLVPGIREDLSDEYASRFTDMLGMWKEAVYSDHSLTEEDRKTMSGFLTDTVSMAKKRADFKEKLKIRFRYAL